MKNFRLLYLRLVQSFEFGIMATFSRKKLKIGISQFLRPTISGRLG